jgi:hypothetical protein
LFVRFTEKIVLIAPQSVGDDRMSAVPTNRYYRDIVVIVDLKIIDWQREIISVFHVASPPAAPCVPSLSSFMPYRPLS